MNTEGKTALIIGATLSGLVAAESIASLFDELIIVESASEESLSKQARHILESGLFINIRLLFDRSVDSFLSDAAGNIAGVRLQTGASGLETIHADVVIDASARKSLTPFLLQCPGYEGVSYMEKSVVITSPYTQTVTIQSYNYHKAVSLPGGLFFIGEAVSNIGQLAEQEDKLANIQAVVLKQYISSKMSNLKFQKNIAQIVSIVVREYIHLAQERVRAEHHLETRGDFALVSY